MFHSGLRSAVFDKHSTEKLKGHISIPIKRQLHWVIPAGQIVIERIHRIMENRWGCNSRLEHDISYHTQGMMSFAQNRDPIEI